MKPKSDYMTDRCGGRSPAPSSEAFQLKVEEEEELFLNEYWQLFHG